jgi:uncharacterized protein
MTPENEYTAEYAVSGMHCAACELLIEDKFIQHPQVTKVDAVLGKNKVFVRLSEDVNPEAVKVELSRLIEPHGYSLLSDVQSKEHSPHRHSGGDHGLDWTQMIKALGFASLVVAAFILLQKSGLLAVSADQISLPFVFLIGIVASLSTCMAVVGGLVLSISGNYAREKQLKPLALFHVSRLISFFVLGGVIGLLGSAFVLTPATNFILSAILFAVMLVLGLNLLDVFPALRRFQLKAPKSLGKQVLSLQAAQTYLTPLLLGAATFVLPCGFTQSMQLYSLTTGSFISGAVTMLVFALGTFPVLALISFASAKFSQTLQSGLFYKTAGFIILFFALFNFTAALAAVGLISPVFNL